MTFDESCDDKQPAWHPDSQSIVFSSDRDGVFNVFRVSIDKPGEVRRLTAKTERFQVPLSWDSRSHRLAILETDEETSENLRIVNLKEDPAAGWTEDTVNDFSATEASEIGAQFSPDGKWLAYVTNERGRFHEVFVCPSSSDLREEKHKRRQVSPQGISVVFPRWSREDPQALTVAAVGTDRGEYQIYMIPWGEGGTSDHGPPAEWNGGVYYYIPKMSGYDLDPSGDRILVRKLAESPDAEEAGHATFRVVLFENFLDYLREEVPGKKTGLSK